MKKILLLCFALFSIVYAEQKERLVVLDPASIETIYMLGAQDQIVGIANLQQSSIYPEEETKKLVDVGTFSHPSLEKIVALKPTLVLLSSYSVNLEEGLKSFGIKSKFIKAERLEDIKANIKTLAQIVHKEKEGDELIKSFEADLQRLQANPIGKTGIYLYSSNPLMAFNDNSLIADVMKLVGIKNLSPQTDVSRPIISAEFILKQNPEILILGIGVSDINEFLNANSLLKHTIAAKEKQIYINPKTHILMRLSPKIVDRIAEFKTKIEKERF